MSFERISQLEKTIQDQSSYDGILWSNNNTAADVSPHAASKKLGLM